MVEHLTVFLIGIDELVSNVVSARDVAPFMKKVVVRTHDLRGRARDAQRGEIAIDQVASLLTFEQPLGL
jgi:hypothetical protein